MAFIIFNSCNIGRIEIDAEFVSSVEANTPCYIKLPKGTYQLAFDDLKDNEDSYFPTTIDLKVNDSDVLLISYDPQELRHNMEVITPSDERYGSFLDKSYKSMESYPVDDETVTAATASEEERKSRLEQLRTQYDKVFPYGEGLAIVARNDVYGLYCLNSDRFVIPMRFQKIWNAAPDYAIIQQNLTCGLLNARGEKVTPIKYEWIEPNATSNLIPSIEYTRPAPTGTVGLIDRQGNEIGEHIYDSVSSINDGLYLLEHDERSFLYDELTGKLTDISKYSLIAEIQNGFIPVKIDDKVSYIDRSAREIIPIQFDKCSYFDRNGLAAVTYNHKCGIIDRDGNYIIQPEYKATYYETDGKWIIVLTQQGKYRIFDKEERTFLPVEYDVFSFISDFTFLFRRGNTWGTVTPDTPETVITDEPYDSMWCIGDGVFAVTRGRNTGVIDRHGNLLVPIAYDNIRQYNNGYYHIATETCDETPNDTHDEKWIWIDSNGNEHAIKGYDSVTKTYADNTIRVTRDGKVGLCRPDGEEILAPSLDNIYEFHNGVAVFCDNALFGIVDSDGHIVAPAIYDHINNFLQETAFASLNGKFGALDTRGNTVIPFRYEAAEDTFHDGYANIGVSDPSLDCPDGDTFFGYINEAGDDIRFLQPVVQCHEDRHICDMTGLNYQ